MFHCGVGRRPSTIAPPLQSQSANVRTDRNGALVRIGNMQGSGGIRSVFPEGACAETAHPNTESPENHAPVLFMLHHTQESLEPLSRDRSMVGYLADGQQFIRRNVPFRMEHTRNEGVTVRQNKRPDAGITGPKIRQSKI